MSANKLKTILDYKVTLEIFRIKNHGHYGIPLNKIVPETTSNFKSVFQAGEVC